MPPLLLGGLSKMATDLKDFWLKKAGIRPFSSELNGKGLKNVLCI